MTLLKLKAVALYGRNRLSQAQWRLLSTYRECGPLRCRILASFITAAAGSVGAKRRAIAELRACSAGTRRDTWAACYMSEAVMFFSGRQIFDGAFLWFAIRILTSARREARVNAAGALAEYARNGDQLAIAALRKALNDPDPAVQSNARSALANEKP